MNVNNKYQFAKIFIVILIAVTFTPLIAYSAGSDVFKLAKPSMVSITASFNNGNKISGSGVIVGKNEILTNCHVIKDANDITILFADKKLANATFKGQVASLDLCALEAETNNRPLVLTISPTELQQGQIVYAIGDPLSLSTTISDGIVSAIRETNQGKLIQITNPISHGSSGGGLFDKNGRLIGITTFTLKYGQNLNFAIPADYRNSLGLIVPEIQKVTQKNQSKTYELTFKGVPLGATVEEFLKSFPNTVCYNDEVLNESVNCKGKGIYYLGEYSSEFFATFNNNSLWMVTVRLSGSDRQKLSLNLRDKVQEHFGQPTDDNLETESDFTSKFGATASWKFDGHKFLSVIRCGDRLILGGCVTDGAEVQIRGPIMRRSDF